MRKKDALTALYTKQASIIYGYLLKHGCRREVAEEIVQDSFVKAIEHFNNIDFEKFTSWIFKVALNNYRNYLRKVSDREELLIDESHFLKQFSVDDGIEDILLLKERAKEIRSCLSCLKQSYRELLILKYEMELSCKEIGRMLELPEQSVKTYLYRAREKFKSLWRDSNE